MRLAVVIAAHLAKLILWLCTVTPRDILILKFAAFGLLVLMFTIMGQQ